MSTDSLALHAELRRVLAQAALAASAEDLDLAALWLVQAELLGLPEFGIRMLARDLDRLDGVSVSAPVAPVTPIGSLDATGVPGVVALATAVRAASEGVRNHGVAIIGLRGVGALGILGTALRTLAASGAVALAAAQSRPFVAPWGATGAAVGTNPLAIATPRADGPPLVLDYATSPLTLAAVREAAQRGDTLPPGTAADASGAPTLVPSEVAALLPDSLTGSLTGLLVEVLAGAATGGRRPDAVDGARGAIIIAFDPARAGGGDAPASAARLAADWTAAGGHLPARFDALPTTVDGLPATVDTDPQALAWLRTRAEGRTT
ncbi:MAG: Ldh family oxidoreductase [Microbacterium sp.]|nr:Ldh family oxidoreductase [Microbacterium sp.]